MTSASRKQRSTKLSYTPMVLKRDWRLAVALHREARQIGKRPAESGVIQRREGVDGLLAFMSRKPRSVVDGARRLNGFEDFRQVLQAALADRLADTLGLLGACLAHGVDQGQGGLAVGQVIAEIFADGVHRAGEIQGVVDELKGIAQMDAIAGQRALAGLGRLGDEGADLGAGLEQARRLVADDVEILLLGQAGVVAIAELDHLALGNVVGGGGQFDKSDLRPDGEATLRRNAEWLRKWTSVKVRVDGCADPRGTNEYNFGLGLRRADVIRAFLVSQGIALDRIEVVAVGETQLVCTEQTEACWARNRRGSFKITAK